MSARGEYEANVDGFGAELRRRRQQAMLTQESLAELAGVDARTIRDIETGRTRRPRASTKRLLRDALPDDSPDDRQYGAGAPQELLSVFPPAVTPFQLPADTAHFTGRSGQLNRLVGLWPGDPDHADDRANGDMPRGAVVISAVDGMAGVGKTALAVHVAHRVADRFEDGVLFTDLHGFTPGVEPASPEHVLDTLLRGLGVPGDQIPPDLAGRAALYRTVLARRRVLIVLDNAADETQLQPLLPAAPGCGVLVTSRRYLAGLDDAIHFSLPALPPREAVALFRALVADRVSLTDDHTIDQIVSQCGHLPVAIRIAAARLRANQTSTPTRLLAELTDALDNGHGLDWLSDGHRAVTAALEVSYHHLTPDQQHAFRLLGLHPGRDVEPYALAALARTTLTQAQQLLDDLHAANLVNQPVYHRYTQHDLVATYTRNLAAADPETARHAALNRLFDHYAHVTSVAMNLAYPWESGHRSDTPPTATPAPPLGDARQARQWLDTELDNLLAAAHNAHNQNRPDHTNHQAATTHRHLHTRGRYTDAHTLHLSALQHTRETCDRAGEQNTLGRLAATHFWQDRHEQAAECYQQLLAIARKTGNRTSEHAALLGIGRIHRRKDRFGLASDCFQQAMAIARDIDDPDGEQQALLGLAVVLRLEDRIEQATAHYRQALTIARHHGNRIDVQIALQGLGMLHLRQNHYGLAADVFEQVLAIARDIGDRYAEMVTLTVLGRTLRMQGHHEHAIENLTQAVTIANQIGSRNGQFEAHQNLGRIRTTLGHHHDAIDHHRTALTLAHDLSQPSDQARAHDGLAHSYHALGDTAGAAHHWHAALDILTGANINSAVDEPHVATATIQTHLAAVAVPKQVHQ